MEVVHFKMQGKQLILLLSMGDDSSLLLSACRALNSFGNQNYTLVSMLWSLHLSKWLVDQCSPHFLLKKMMGWKGENKAIITLCVL